MPTDTDILDALEAANPGLRAAVTACLTEAGGATLLAPTCGLCSAPVANGCEHVAVLDRERVSMRQLVDRRCRNCNHAWTQPSKRGACPHCQSRDVVNLDIRQCGVMRS